MNKISIDIASFKNSHLHLIIKGTNEYGLDKSIINALRRILLDEIPTTAFHYDEYSNENDILILKNNTSLHNEMILQRISFLPLYIDPNIDTKYLFECHVQHDGKTPFQFIHSNHISIYPQLDEPLNDNKLDPTNYDLENPLNQSEKDKIFRPYLFRDQKNYCLLTELKNTHSSVSTQELHFYASPSVKTGNIKSNYQSCSRVSYSFLKNDSLINEILSDKFSIDNISPEDQDSYRTKFMNRESERYFHRDDFNEPNQYNFNIESQHAYDSKQLFLLSIEILLQKCNHLRDDLLLFLENNPSSVSIDKHNDFVYNFTLNQQNHTLGNLLQNHIVRRSIHEKSILNGCAYKKPHPLEESILFILSINSKHKITRQNEVQKVQLLTEFLRSQLEECKNDIKILLQSAKDTL